MISYTSLEKSTYKLPNKRAISAWIKDCAKREKDAKIGELSIVFCTDDELLQVNREYLQHDYYTDIITFDYCEGNTISGDLMISCDTVESNSKIYGTAPRGEMHRAIIHGVLHLLGYKDKSESEQALMTSKEDFYLSLLTD